MVHLAHFGPGEKLRLIRAPTVAWAADLKWSHALEEQEQQLKKETKSFIWTQY